MLTLWNDWPSPWLGDPLRAKGPFRDLRRQMDRMLEEMDRHAPSAAERGGPRFTLEDQGEALEVRAELPGFRPEDLEVQLERTTLSLRGRREVKAPDGYVTHRRERRSVEIARAFTLPCRVDPEKASAKLEDGVLTLTLPKLAAEQPRRIEVQVG